MKTSQRIEIDEVKEESELPKSELTVSRKLHPEDIAIGDDVAVYEVTYQYASFLWCGADTTRLPPEEYVRIPFIPREPVPLIVKSVCLPYVLCEKHDGKHEVIDLRLHRLVRLDKGHAKLVREKFKADQAVNRKKSKAKKNSKRNKGSK